MNNSQSSLDTSSLQSRSFGSLRKGVRKLFKCRTSSLHFDESFDIVASDDISVGVSITSDADGDSITNNMYGRNIKSYYIKSKDLESSSETRTTVDLSENSNSSLNFDQLNIHVVDSPTNYKTTRKIKSTVYDKATLLDSPPPPTFTRWADSADALGDSTVPYLELDIDGAMMNHSSAPALEYKRSNTSSSEPHGCTGVKTKTFAKSTSDLSLAPSNGLHSSSRSRSSR
jgi:hypothetical protein